VRSPQAGAIASALADASVTVRAEASDVIVLTGLDTTAVGQAAARHGWLIQELAPVVTSLEAAYLDLTQAAVEYRSGATDDAAAFTHRGVRS
jgi:ABC-2 type transport system ATP-binding protein